MLTAVCILWLVAGAVVIWVSLSFKCRIDRLADGEVKPAIREIRDAVREIDRLAGEARSTVKRIDRIASSIEVIATGASLASAASKVVSGSRDTLVSVIAGIKEGLRALRRATPEASSAGSNQQADKQEEAVQEESTEPKEPQESKEGV